MNKLLITIGIIAYITATIMVFNLWEPIAAFAMILIPIIGLALWKRKSTPLLLLPLILTSCSTVPPNNEGVLMTNFGRNGMQDFKLVTGRLSTIAPGTSLYSVPMYEQRGDCPALKVYAADAGEFTVDPTYVYKPIRGKGIEIVFNYKHLGAGDKDFYENIEASILNTRVLNAYREASRNFTTDSLMGNVAGFEAMVQARLLNEFEKANFALSELSSNLTPPDGMKRAIEERNNAVQQARQVQNQLETSRMLLEKSRIDAEANKAASAGLTKEMLTHQYIEALRTTKNKVIITDGKTPIIIQ